MHNKLELSPELFRRLRDVIYDRSGIFFPENKVYLLEARLNRRLLDLGLNSFQEYLQYLGDAAVQAEEFKHIYNLVTINETYFFRYQKQLDVFGRSLLPLMLKQRAADAQKTLSIWSAAAASGEELFSLAILLYEALGLTLDQWNLELRGTDISKEILEKAKKGIYGPNSFRDPALAKIKSKYFSRVGEHYQINPELQEMVSFDYLNLNDVAAIQGIGRVDFIFCRNVLIYFDQDMKKRVVNAFYDVLNHGGYLLLGETESLHGISSAFNVEHYPGAFVYQKE